MAETKVREITKDGIAEIPDGWDYSTLGAIGEYINGKAFKSSDWTNKGRPIIRIQDLTHSKDNPNYYDGQVEDCYIIRHGDFLVSWSATLGAYFWDGPEGVLNQHIFKVNSYIDKCFHKFLVEYILIDLQRETHGSGMVHVTKGKFDNTLVPIAPLVEQKRIVAKIEELLPLVNAVKERLNRASLIMKRFRQAVLSTACSGRLTEGWRETYPQVNSDSQDKDIVVGYYDLPEGWHWHKAGDFYDDARYGTSVKCSYTDNGTPVLRIPNIVTGQIALSNIKYAELGKKELESLLLRAGDIIVCRTNGSLDLIGKAAVVPMLPVPHAFASYLIRLRLRNESLQPEYFHLFISSQVGRNQIEEHARTTAGQFNLNLRILSELVIPVPPVAEQNEIVRRVEALFKIADVIEQRIEAARLRADKLTQSILAKAFRGELVPTEAELARQEGRPYEPAAVLLERIKTEKEKMPSSPRRGGSQ